MTLGQRLRKFRKRAGYTQKELAQSIGAKHNSVCNWEKDQNRPDAATLGALCEALGVTPNDLLLEGEATSRDTDAALTAGERRLLERYRMLDVQARGAVDALLSYYCPPVAQPPRAAAPTLQVLTRRISIQPVAAGTGAYLEDDAFEDIRLLQNPQTQRAAFLVPVTGDSMEPRFRHGDILMVEEGAVLTGEIGIFTLGGQGYVKIRGDRELLSLNPAYGPIPMEEGIHCNGKVLGVLDPAWIVE